jgi:hypothetical protein
MTMFNGQLLRNRSRIRSEAINFCSVLLSFFPTIKDSILAKQFSDEEGLKPVTDGFFLRGRGGGGKIARAWLRSADNSYVLSDAIFWRHDSILTIVKIDTLGFDSASEQVEIERIVEKSNLSKGVLSSTIISISESSERGTESGCEQFRVATIGELQKAGIPILERYSPQAFRRRFESSTRYALVRPDMIIFAQTATLAELNEVLAALNDWV